MKFRSILFWVHLAAGAIAGLVIAVMCATGAALSFENEIVNWTERDVRLVQVPANATRVGVHDLIENLRDEDPDVRPTAIVVSSDPRVAVTFQLGRDGVTYANPYTGEIHAPASSRARALFRSIEDWHRTLALGGDRRPLGKLVNGTGNIAFCVLAITGLYLWFPRSWSWRSVRAIAWFVPSARGKARDFNWHNAIGLWCAPVLIVLTLTAIPMSFRWGSDLIFRLVGETPPTADAPGFAASSVVVPPPPAGAKRLGQDALISAAQQAIPDWQELTLRLGAGGQRGGNGTANPRASNASNRDATNGNAKAATPRARETRTGAQAATVVVRRPGQWPRTANTTLSLDPYTGAILQREGYAEQTASRRVRSWTRFLHTGQALGAVGQFVAGLACLGGCVLVYTGFALAIRRFLAWRKRPA